MENAISERLSSFCLFLCLAFSLQDYVTFQIDLHIFTMLLNFSQSTTCMNRAKGKHQTRCDAGRLNSLVPIGLDQALSLKVVRIKLSGKCNMLSIVIGLHLNQQTMAGEKNKLCFGHCPSTPMHHYIAQGFCQVHCDVFDRRKKIKWHKCAAIGKHV